MERPSENPKKAAKLMVRFHGIDRALESNNGAISFAEKAKNRKAVEILKEVQMELRKIEKIKKGVS